MGGVRLERTCRHNIGGGMGNEDSADMVVHQTLFQKKGGYIKRSEIRADHVSLKISPLAVSILNVPQFF